MTALAAEQARRTPDPARCRRLFLEGIQNAPESIVRLMSCSIDEVSTDDDTRGGRYNGSLIECVGDWAQVQANNRLGGDNSLSIVAAHECAAEKTRRLGAGQQNPTIEKARTGPYFPIAVFS